MSLSWNELLEIRGNEFDIHTTSYGMYLRHLNVELFIDFPESESVASEELCSGSRPNG